MLYCFKGAYDSSIYHHVGIWATHFRFEGLKTFFCLSDFRLNVIGPFCNLILVDHAFIFAIAVVAHSRPSITTYIYPAFQDVSCIRVLMHTLMHQ